ncbi:MAG: septal ring lytic transglycosylase RlpA family protein [Candidatus Hydrogenedentes bacterium]|nr:septal ring lytic transglycosylase RlpA family protein [Candidatus Hydrogenedentota bacterium]
MFQIVALMILSQQPVPPVAEGIASYYTVASSGRVTASGEALRDEELTCALRNGVFGDYYLVVAENGKSVICRLNDRGPYVKGRVIDLSEAAMRKLAVNTGLIKVHVYHIGADPPLEPASPRLRQYAQLGP